MADGGGAVLVLDDDEALARLAEMDPDLVLTDMMMPQMDGFEFLARLRAHSPRPDVPVLIVSDLGDFLAETIDDRAARTLRLAGILPKGMPLEKLVARVERLIGRPRPAEA